MCVHYLVCDGVVTAVVAVLDVLLRKLVFYWFLVSAKVCYEYSIQRYARVESYLYGHSVPRLHSPLTKNEQTCGLLRL